MKKLLLAGASLLAAGTLSVTSASAAEMGATDEPIKLAINEWTGQHLSTHIAGEILERAGYQVEYVTAGYMNMAGAMSEGEIHAAMEVWSSNVAETITGAVDAGALTDLGDLGLTAREGFAYPAHVKDLCPGLPDWEALKACAVQFATAETIPQGRLLDYPADWGTPGADRVAGLELPFKAVPAGSEGALIAEARAAVEKKSPLLMVFWQPHWAMSAYGLEFADLPAGTDACYNDPSWGSNPNAVNDCDFAATRVYKVGWSGIAEKWPAAGEILASYQLSTADQQPLMGMVDVDGKSVEEVASAWVDANEAAWKPMVDAATN